MPNPTPRLAGPPAATVEPRMALVFYDVNNANESLHGELAGGQSGVAAFRHEFAYDAASGTHALGTGAPIGPGDVAELVTILADQQRRSGLQWHPERLLATGPEALVWYVPPQVRPMWFTTTEGVIRVTVPWPGLVFRAQPDGLRVAAYQGSDRPGPETPLFHAPLANIYGNGWLCLGNVHLPDRLSAEDLGAWEALIYDTLFSTPNHGDTLRLDGADEGIGGQRHLGFWQDLDGADAFPESVLVPRRDTLAEFGG